ncbi:uncharacterized protein LOC123507672 [Portunus trituberculatus]|uniref:uncharacterized protein LOC123507672 n=1 Tax=Portunus trituberculatus TaxID=210409 RepID=UPI001E1CE907|nr:uncharacterized protein LOC123507672 [Portunus trituberculatus]
MRCCRARRLWSREGVKEAWLGPLEPPAQTPTKEHVRRKQSLMLPRIISCTYRVFGMHPCTFDRTTHQYTMRWCSPSAWYSLVLLAWLSLLLVMSLVGMVRLFSSDFHSGSRADEMQLMAMLIIVGCLLNAWMNMLCRLLHWRSFCDFINRWMHIASTTDLHPFRRSDIMLFVYVASLIAFLGSITAMSMSTSSDLFLGAVDVLARVLLLTEDKAPDNTSWKTQVFHVVLAVVVVQIYLVYKLSLFFFVAACHFLYNSLDAWRGQLSGCLEAIWEDSTDTGGGGGGGFEADLAQLVNLHYELVQMVRHTERLFSPTLQCFYGTQVVTLCLELYLVAYRVGIGAPFHHLEAAWQLLVIVQTCLVFLFVSLKASRVAEAAENCTDILRRSLPYSASVREKYHFSELVVALTSDRICITGGRFFYINRPFIITVVGAVVSYFVIVLQLKLPTVSAQVASG